MLKKTKERKRELLLASAHRGLLDLPAEIAPSSLRPHSALPTNPTDHQHGCHCLSR